MRISIIMVLFKTNGPVKIHIQCIITKSVYSLFPLWLDLRTVVVTSACLIPSFHCPSSHWISPRMLWNIKEKEWGLPMNLYRGLQLIIVVLIILLIINNDLMMDLIRNISPHEGLNKKHFNVLTQWQHYRNPRRQKTRSLGHGVEFLVTSYKDLQHSGCGYTINAHELSSLGSVYFLWYIRLLIKKLILS